MFRWIAGARAALVVFALLLVPGAAHAASFPVNSLLDDADANPGNGACATAGGQCTLRAAIQELNATPGGPHSITFSVSGVIHVNASGLGPLPTITKAMTINGGGSPSSTSTLYTTNATFSVVIDGKTNGSTGNGFLVDLAQAIPPVHPASAANAVTIKGLVIQGFQSGAGIQLVTGYNTVQGCFIGTAQNGMSADPLVTGNNTGIAITATAGSNALDGHNLIGGVGSPNPFSNLISGNKTDGIDISGQSGFNVVQGNVIGTNATGTAALSNGDNGVWISGDSANTQIGGPSSPAGSFAGNLISGNDTTGTGAGILIVGTGSINNVVYGNRIGTNAAGTAAIPNGAIIAASNGGDGVQIAGGANLNTVGSVTNNQGNVISGNIQHGVNLAGGDNNIIAANYIGTTANGAAVLGNHCDGVYVASSGNRIGGTALLEGNIIAGSLGDAGCTGVTPHGNGLHISVGGNNQILQNAIGIDPNTDTSLANAGVGIWITGGSSAVGNKIGNGLPTGANQINFNGALGISVGGNGTTPSVNSGSLFTGPNNYMNYPVLTAVTPTSAQGTFDYPNGIQTYNIDFFSTPSGQLDPSGHGEGAQYEGTVQVITDVTGHATFNYPFGVALLPGRVVSAIATDINTGNSSEFSGNFVPTPVELQGFSAD